MRALTLTQPWAGLVASGIKWFFGPIGYVLRDVQALPEPVLCRGWQGFWTLTPNLERAVAAQIIGSPRAAASTGS